MERSSQSSITSSFKGWWIMSEERFMWRFLLNSLDLEQHLTVHTQMQSRGSGSLDRLSGSGRKQRWKVPFAFSEATSFG